MGDLKVLLARVFTNFPEFEYFGDASFFDTFLTEDVR